MVVGGTVLSLISRQRVPDLLVSLRRCLRRAHQQQLGAPPARLIPLHCPQEGPRLSQRVPADLGQRVPGTDQPLDDVGPSSV